MTRYYVSLWLNKPGSPRGTFTVNMAGCAILGILAAVSADQNNFPSDKMYDFVS